MSRCSVYEAPTRLLVFLRKCEEIYESEITTSMGLTRVGGKEGAIPRAPNHYGSAEWLWGLPKSPNNAASSFFNALHLLPKDLRFENGAPNLLLAPGAIWPRYAPGNNTLSMWFIMAGKSSESVRFAIPADTDEFPQDLQRGRQCECTEWTSCSLSSHVHAGIWALLRNKQQH